MAEQPTLHPTLAGYFGLIQKAVDARLPTAEFYNTLRSALAEQGQTLAGISIGDVSRARGLAASVRNSREIFAKASEDSTITNNMVSQNWYSRDLNSQALSPKFDIRFQHTFIQDGVEQTAWRTITNLDITGLTKGEIMANIIDTAEFQFTQAYEGIIHQGVGSVEISAV